MNGAYVMAWWALTLAGLTLVADSMRQSFRNSK